jgi:hypothetical protein
MLAVTFIYDANIILILTLTLNLTLTPLLLPLSSLGMHRSYLKDDMMTYFTLTRAHPNYYYYYYYYYDYYYYDYY